MDSLSSTRTYRQNSPQAAGRLVALALIANGEIKASEWAILYELQARERLGLRGEDWHALLDTLCYDLLASATDGSHCVIDRQTLARWYGAVDDPDLQCLVAELSGAIVRADGHVDEAETAILRGALEHWVLPAEAQAQLEPILHGLDFQVTLRRVTRP